MDLIQGRLLKVRRDNSPNNIFGQAYSVAENFADEERGGYWRAQEGGRGKARQHEQGFLLTRGAIGTIIWAYSSHPDPTNFHMSVSMRENSWREFEEALEASLQPQPFAGVGDIVVKEDGDYLPWKVIKYWDTEKHTPAVWQKVSASSPHKVDSFRNEEFNEKFRHATDEEVRDFVNEKYASRIFFST